MEKNAPAIKMPESEWTKEQIQTIKDTVAVGANNSELNMFLSIAAKYELDPFLREIWFANMGTRNAIITGRDGYLKIANRNPNFNGMVSDVVCSNDRFIKEGDTVKHAYNVKDRGQIVGAYAVVYRKDRDHPAYFFASFREYNKGVNVWRQYPSAMIIKVAEAMALKRAFSISGLVTEEEISDSERVKTSVETGAKERALKRGQDINKIWQSYLSICGNADDARITISEITGKNSSSEFTGDDIKTLYADLQRRFNEAENSQEPETIEVEEIANNSGEQEAGNEE